MQTSIKTQTPSLDFKFLPSFANFILDNYLDEYVKEQIRLSKEIDLPLLKYFASLSEGEMVDLLKKTNTENLRLISQNKIKEQIQIANNSWVNNQISLLSRDEIVAEDIAKTSYMRSQCFLKFIPAYTEDPTEIIELITEINRFALETDTLATDTYIDLLQKRIKEHIHFIHNEKIIAEKLQLREEQLLKAQEIANIGSFEWDMANDEAITSPQVLKIFEFNNEEKFPEFISRVHPSDQLKVKTALKEAIEGSGIYDCEFRFITNEKEKVIWSHAVIQYENRKAIRMKGTIMDVTNRHHMIQRLQRSEELYKQAQAITNIGNYIWNLKTYKITWSDELYRIYGLDPFEEITYEKIFPFNHPDDFEIMRQKTQSAIENHTPFDFTYRIIMRDKTQKILHARGEVLCDENTGEAYKVIGTAQDVTEREEILSRLRESEDLYKQSQSIAHVGNWAWDVNENKITWSDELYRIFGIEKGPLIDYSTYISLIHPDDVHLITANVERALKFHEPYEFHHRVKWKDGSVRILHSRGEPMIDSNGQVYKLLGTAQDVTEKEELIDRLKENQKFIKKIADATPSIIASYNIKTGQYRFISQGLEKLLGYEAELPLKKGVAFFADLIHPDDVQSMMEKNSKALELANSQSELNPDLIVEFQYRMRHKNGQYRWFHTYGTIFDRNAEGKVEHVLNISLDITETKLAEQKIREQEHFIQNIAEASPTILYLYDVKKNQIDYINQEIKNVIGFSPEEIIEMGASFRSDLYHPDDISKLPEKNEGYEDLAKDVNSMFEYECRMKAKNGTWRWLLVREIIFSRNDNGKPSQVLGAAIDISERKEIEQTLYQKNMQLEQSNTSLEEFAYVASHDLQEPLRKISVFGDRLMAVEKELKKENRIYLKKIIDSSLRMQALIDDLLIISRISHDKSFRQYSLQTVLNEVLQLLEHKIEKQKAIVKSDTLPSAEIIPSQFRQLFLNLISNSLKFIKTDVPPLINITWKYLSQSEVSKYSIAKSRHYLQIKFTDNGIGFENEYSGRIFAIFQRLHGKTEYEGTGIGLSICKKIVENHGGIILASGEPDKGSTFTIIIPA